MKYWKETVFRAAVLGCVLGGPAAALDFTAAPERIEGVSLGMSLAEVRDLLEDKGFVALSTRTDIETPEGRVFGRIRPFGKPSTMEILQVEIGPDGPLQDKVFRVTAKFPESRLDDATLALLNDRFGDPHCADGTYRFDGDWAPSDAPDCDTTMFIPEGVMSAEIAQRVMADPAPRYSAVIGKLPGDDPLVIVSTQDNRLASALGLPPPPTGSPGPRPPRTSPPRPRRTCRGTPPRSPPPPPRRKPRRGRPRSRRGSRSSASRPAWRWTRRAPFSRGRGSA